MINLTVDPEDYGYVREDSVPNVARMQDMLEGVLYALYTSGDTVSLEHCLEEACAEINMGLPDRRLKVRSR